MIAVSQSSKGLTETAVKHSLTGLTPGDSDADPSIQLFNEDKADCLEKHPYSNKFIHFRKILCLFGRGDHNRIKHSFP